MAASPASAPCAVASDQLVVRAAVYAFLGSYRGQTRVHTASGLNVFLRVPRVHGNGGKVVLVPLPPAVVRAID